MIRIHNVSSLDYQELEVGDEQYGDVRAGEYTDRRAFATAYRYNYVRLIIDGNEFILQPIDYVGETPLGSGDFTYDIDIIDYDGRVVAINAVAD